MSEVRSVISFYERARGATSKARNLVAGYITRVFAGTQTSSPNESIEEGE